MALITLEELSELRVSEERNFLFGGKRFNFSELTVEFGVDALSVDVQLQTIYSGIKINQISVEINKTQKQQSLEKVQNNLVRGAVIDALAMQAKSEKTYDRNLSTELDAKHARANIAVANMDLAHTLIQYIEENIHIDALIEQDDSDGKNQLYVVMMDCTQKEVNKVIGLHDRIKLGRKVVGGTKKTFDTVGKGLETTIRGSAPIFKGILSATAAAIKGTMVATTQTAAHAVNVSVETAKGVAREVATNEDCLRAVDRTMNGIHATRRVVGGTRTKNKGVTYE